MSYERSASTHLVTEQERYCKNSYPGRPLRRSGSPANLQVALDAILLIDRNDNHANILGATVSEIKILRWSAPFCRELPARSCGQVGPVAIAKRGL